MTHEEDFQLTVKSGDVIFAIYGVAVACIISSVGVSAIIPVGVSAIIPVGVSAIIPVGVSAIMPVGVSAIIPVGVLTITSVGVPMPCGFGFGPPQALKRMDVATITSRKKPILRIFTSVSWMTAS